MKVNEHSVCVFGTCVSLFQERYMDHKQANGLLCLAKCVLRVLSQDRVFYKRLMHINKMVRQPSTCGTLWLWP